MCIICKNFALFLMTKSLANLEFIKNVGASIVPK